MLFAEQVHIVCTPKRDSDGSKGGSQISLADRLYDAKLVVLAAKERIECAR